MIRRSIIGALIAGFIFSNVPVRAADVILNEYNAVDNDIFLKNTNSDVFWGRRQGNGRDWFELVVITDHLDMRAWEFLVVNQAGDALNEQSWLIKLTMADVWSDLRRGTIITISEDLGNNANEYNPAIGHWWINVRAAADTAGTYATVSCVSPTCLPAVVNWRVTNNNWQLTISDSVGTVIYGPAGEGIFPLSGVGSDEVFKLEADPSGSIVPMSIGYRDGTSSTFGQPNVYDAGATVQDLSGLRSVVPFTQLSSIRINEVFSHSDPALDWVELLNTTGTAIDISGWYLSDSFNDLQKYEIPAATTIAANGYLVFDENDLGFAFDAGCGDEIILSVGNGLGGLTGERDFAEFGAVENGVSFGRSPNGTSSFVRLSTVTQGAANGSPLIPPVVLNEIMYHPPAPGIGIVVDPEFIELRNTTGSSVGLFSDFGINGTFPWRLTGGLDFAFSLSTTIPAGGYLVVVNFDPAVDTTQLTEFRDIYGVDASVNIVGPYTGKLNNFSDTVRLRKPDTPEAGLDCDGNPGPFTPQVIVEELVYFDFGTWPTGADGGGSSIERATPLSVATDTASWRGNTFPSPGSATCGDATVEAGEDCDDGNQDDGDCCSAACELDPVGTSCDDRNACTLSDQCDGAGTCAGSAEPEPSCRTALKGALQVKDGVPNSRDKFAWKFIKGIDETLHEDFGNPEDPTSNGTTYYLCGYDYTAGTPSLIMDIVLPNGGTCFRGVRPCWIDRGSTRGFVYRGRDDTAGISGIALKPGVAGRPKITIKAKGEQLPTPNLPFNLDPQLTMQLKNSTGMCWGIDFDQPPRFNRQDKFKVTHKVAN